MTTSTTASSRCDSIMHITLIPPPHKFNSPHPLEAKNHVQVPPKLTYLTIFVFSKYMVESSNLARFLTPPCVHPTLNPLGACNSRRSI